jgi:hypothetical protein
MLTSFVLEEVNERLATLHARYRVECNGMINHRSYGSAQVTRTQLRRDYNLCSLFRELLELISLEHIDLSDEAMDGLTKLIEPTERHRRKKVEEII